MSEPHSSSMLDTDFLAPLVLQYLDVASMVRFGATSRDHRHFQEMEIARRKDEITKYELKIEALVGGVDDDNDEYDKSERIVLTHDNVLLAVKLKQQAYALVTSDTEPGPIKTPKNHVFSTELLKFKLPERLADGSIPRRSPLAMLPLCFYPSKNCNRNSKSGDEFDEETILEMMKADCRRLWRLVDDPRFTQLQADFAAAFTRRPCLLETFRTAARHYIFENRSSNKILPMMETTIALIESKLEKASPSEVDSTVVRLL